MNAPIADKAVPILDIETELLRLGGLVSLADLLVTSDAQITADAMEALAGSLGECHGRLKALWQRAYRQQSVDRELTAEAHTAALAAIGARKAAPGSPADVEKARVSWDLLRAAAKVALEACDKAEGARP